MSNHESNNPRAIKIFISAGEASGDLHGAELIRALKRIGNCDVVGMGGTAMCDAGLRVIKDISDMQVMGFVDVIKHLGHFRRVMKQVKHALIDESPDALLLVDYPGFNLRLARIAKTAGIPTYQYVAPQVWAWRQGRARTLSKVVDHLLVFFQFERQFFSRFHDSVHFIGHPLRDEINMDTLPRASAELRRKLGISDHEKPLALLPGSRTSEINRLLPIYRDALTVLQDSRSSPANVSAVPVLVARSPSTRDDPVWNGLETDIRSGILKNWHLVDEPAVTVAAASHLAAVASGTATLETALAGTPMIICYKADSVSVSIARQLLDIPVIGLVNIVFGKPVCPELIQEHLTGVSLASHITRLYEDDMTYCAIQRTLRDTGELLGDPGSSNRAAAFIYQTIHGETP